MLSVLDDILDRPTGQKIGALVGIVLAVVVLDWQYWYGPNQRDLSDVNAQVAEKRADLDMSIYAKSSQPDFSRTVDGIPNEISREANSNVLIQNGNTVVLGGIFRQTQDDRESGLPYLRRIPALGWLFKRMLVSLPLVIKANAVGRADSGDIYRSNTARYTLTLRHTCSNGRVDDGEQCDPNAVVDLCDGRCVGGACTIPNGAACTTDGDCVQGTCVAPDDPSECTCSY